MASGEDALRKLKAQRASYKGTVTRIENFVNDPINLTSSSVEMLKARRDKLLSTMRDYEAVQLDILMLLPEDKEGIEVIEEKYFTIVSKLDYALKTLTAKEVSTCPNVASSKLPSIDIAAYDGKDFTKYTPFIDLFTAIFHNNKSLSDVQKLFYLRKYLKDEALNVIINLPLINESYAEALELLNKRFDNKSRLINNHINIILELPPMQKSTAVSIRQFTSQIKQQIHALKNLGQPVNNWDMLLICILIKKLDQYMKRAFHLDRDPDTLPTMAEFITFLEKRAMALEESGERCTQESNPNKSFKATNIATNVNIKDVKKCRYCNNAEGHSIYACPKFRLLSESDRFKFVDDQKLCTSCLNSHNGKCKFNFKCRTCKKPGHNTLLHRSSNIESEQVTLHSSSSTDQVVLPTIKVKLQTYEGRKIFVRALLDSGSQASFITTSLMQKLPVSPYTQETNIVGIGNKHNKIDKCVDVDIYSPVQNVQLNVKCHVVDTITTPLPQRLDISNLKLPKGIQLADETFSVPSEISLLLGADVYFNILCLNENIRLCNGPVLMKTLFGYVVGGRMTASQSTENCSVVSNFAICDPQKLEDVMQKFWLSEKLPEISTGKAHNLEFQKAEECYQQSVKLENNQFHVDMPLSDDIGNLELGDSFSVALQRFLALEKRFKYSPLYLEKYKKFIEEYIALGHAKIVDVGEYDIQSGSVYFLAHHAVLNEDSLTTKLRVVFDGSMRSKSGVSLNDVMLNGPVVQSELFDILLLWRTYIYTLICDIQKMFRCVFINSHQKSLQNILWRDDPNKPISCLQLQTVTYGLKSSSFLVTRCLIMLADVYKDEFPLAAKAMHFSTYVDDVISGSDSTEELIMLKEQLIGLLEKGSFTLHKWCSNLPQVIDDLPNDKKYFETLDINKNNIVKALGLKCDILNDNLSFTAPMINDDEINSKRKVLSFIGKWFDPLGIIGPIIVVLKLFMQTIWSLKLDWDDTLPQEQLNTWKNLLNNLNSMETIEIPRGVNSHMMTFVELVGYGDASLKAFGCCLYLRVINSDGTVSVRLLCSKSRVAPLNKSLTIPKLELNSSLLLSQVAHRVHNILTSRFPVKVYLYSDSQIVLAWIKSSNIKSNPYVSKRVEQIKDLTKEFTWSYVSTDNNPADILSRGCEPQKLKSNDLWWYGPKELSNKDFQHLASEITLPIACHDNDQVVSTCGVSEPNESNSENVLLKLIEKSSDINKLKRVVAYILRFKNNCIKNNSKATGSLTPTELQQAQLIIIKIMQKKHFSIEIQSIQKKIPIKSGLANLHPFMDDSGILRVGGRLDKAKNISYEKIHPIIIPKSCHLTDIIIHNEHLRLLHAGARLVLSSLSQKFWLVSGIREVKKIVNKCVKCFRMKAGAAMQLMGSLPEERLTAVRPFHIVGVDFCGPFKMKVSRIRRPIITKGYVALFVCFATKAIHMELVSDLTTEAFLACLKRFISRRGMPVKIFCDNAKTYKGAAHELHNLFNLKEHVEYIQNYCLSHYNIEFKFIPSYAPEFGGLWEAGVKSFKSHFKKIVGDIALSFEGLYTVVTEIEAVLNSRPLLPMSSDISSFEYLSPGHFLIGTPMMSYPEHNVSGININRLKFWKMLSKIKQDFWKVWSGDYLTQLQSRPKWRHPQPNLKEGDLVIVRSDNTAPLMWPMARIVKTLPGPDGRVRVAEIKMANGKTYVRSYRKLSPLPIS